MKSQLTGIRSHIQGIIRPRIALLGATGWIAAQHGVQQILRLGTNIALARLLGPELLGIMVLINTFRAGGELLSDVGIGQSIVSDPQGNKPSFYNTAWTIQIIRGALLFGMALAATYPLSRLYDSPQLETLLPVAAVIFIIAGFRSPSRYLLQKEMRIRRLALIGMGMALSSAVIHISLALYTPTIWALIGALLLTALGGTVTSFFLIDWRMHQVCFNIDAIRSIFGFGKWLFLSSIVYFLAWNFDRLYFASVIPFALLGVYGIARTLAEAITQLFLRVSQLLIFPKFAAARENVGRLRTRILPVRQLALVLMALGLAALIAVSDTLVLIFYDERYRAATVFLPILLVGTWFAILASAGEAMMMGIGKSSSVAASNGAKLLVVVTVVPFVVSTFGFVAAIAAVVVGDVARYAVLVWRKRAHGIAFVRQDIAITALFLGSILLFRELGYFLGLTDGVSSWSTDIGIGSV